METITLARIAVSAATYGIDKPYAYEVPAPLRPLLDRGVRVLVPFGRGNRAAEGIVLEVGAGEKRKGLKSVISVLDPAPVLDQTGLRLALWMRDRYFCTVYDAVRTILPAGLWFRTQTICRPCAGIDKAAAYLAAMEIPGTEPLLDIIYANGGAAEESLLKTACGAQTAARLNALCSAGILCREAEAVRQVKDGKIKMVALALSPEEAMTAIESRRRSAPLQYDAVKLLCTVGAVSQAELCYFTGASASTVSALKKRGLVKVYEEEKLRIHTVCAAPEEAPKIVLNEEQQAAYEQIAAAMEERAASVTLLHGVTGSGKTLVYLRLVQRALEQGRTAVVLVPEIALTPQMMRKFTAYFGDRVAMIHSALRVTELYDQWKRIGRGEVSVVLGTRSAIFSPLKNIGLVILDEEQEASYQSEQPPRYDAREIARYLCAVHGGALVLGSATPSVESYWQARSGTYRCAVLRRRYNRKPLPEVVFADMKEETRRGNGGILSAPLRLELQKNFAAGEQSILLLNRRGNSRMLLCGECGYVPQCPRCSVPLTYHSANERLMCHYCGHTEPAANACPACGGLMKRIGTGTQKAEEELRALYPEVEVLRMDADTVAAKGGHEKILRRFAKKNVPILLGTQMVAKGLDFDNVTLVGVLSADLSLYLDRYNAAERTFSLLTQVVGRAGRGEKRGRAVIQTYTPENEVLQAAARQDYEQFYQSEIRMRRLHEYPPFSDLFTLIVSGADESRVLRASALLRDAMRAALQKDSAYAGEPIQIVGPAPAPVIKVNNRYRYHLYLVAKNNKTVRGFIAYYIKAFSASGENRALNIFVHCNAAD